MFKVIILSIFLSYSLFAANNTLLEKQLKAINKQLSQNNKDLNDLELQENQGYQYNQNIVEKTPPTSSEGFYIGIQQFTGFFSSKSDNPDFNKEETTRIEALKIGYVFRSNNRIELTLTHEKTLSYTEFTHKISGLDVNAIYLKALNKNKSLHGKLQGGAGFYKYSVHSLEGLAVSPSVGLIMDMTPNVEFDISYKYQMILWRDFQKITDSPPIDYTSFSGLVWAINYKF